MLITEINICEKITIFNGRKYCETDGNIIKKKLCNKTWTAEFMHAYRKRVESKYNCKVNFKYKEM